MAYLDNFSNLHKSNMAAQIPQISYFPNTLSRSTFILIVGQLMRCDLCIISPFIILLP